MNYFVIEQKLINWYKNIPTELKKSLLYSFLLINLAFLFHTINFMFGDHDWNYVKQATSWKEGAFEGRPLHFVLQSVLFSGQILPILNNLFSFFAMSLSSIMLARYLKIPLTTFNYTLFATFIGVMPYTLVWLFYAKDALINLTIPLIIMSSLWLSQMTSDNVIKRFLLYAISILLMFFAFSSYVASISMVGVCVLGGIIVDYLRTDKNLISTLRKYLPTIVNTTIALALFKLYLVIFPTEISYNTKIIPLSYAPEKFFITMDAMFMQFTAILPFMEYKYKMLLLIMMMLGLFSLALSTKMYKFIPALGMLFLVIFASKFAFFISDARGEVLAEMEDLAYVPRLDFYGLVYVYALFLSFVLSSKKDILRKSSITLAVIITFMSMVRDAYALKTWKLGFDAEMKAHERIVSRIEQHKNYIPGKKYQILQIGSLSLRKNFYKKNIREKVGLDTLETSFTPRFMSHIVYNFYLPNDMFVSNTGEYSLSPKARDYILNTAEVWPSQKSIYIDGAIIVVVLSSDALNEKRVQMKYR